MSLADVKVSKRNGCTLFHMEDLSEEFKDEIRKQLRGVFHGFAHIEGVPRLSYKYTVKEFLRRFKQKSLSIKKGMVGELLAHVLINKYLKDLKTLSVLKNKEEGSIKKGFDILYFSPESIAIWYTEVKSGKGEPKHDSNKYNTVLLTRSRVSLGKMFTGSRNTLWESALVDVDLVIKGPKNKKELKNKIFDEVPARTVKSKKRNAILVSVLYHKLKDKISIDNLEDFLNETIKKKKFQDVLVISIQKATLEKVINFLKSEAK